MINFKNLSIVEHNFQNNPLVSLGKIDDIEMLIYKSHAFECMISLQGAQLLHWQPESQPSIIFTSPEATFIKGTPIRGGVPVCWPWFGKRKTPMHGFARILDWKITQLVAQEHHLDVVLTLVNSEETRAFMEADFRLDLQFKITAAQCDLVLSYQSSSQALADTTAALHTYFEIGDIAHTYIQNAGDTCFNSLTTQTEKVPDPRHFDQKIDCIYPASSQPAVIVDVTNQRKISVAHHASNIVVWNPWEGLPDMALASSRNMLCVESAYIDQVMPSMGRLGQTITYSVLDGALED